MIYFQKIILFCIASRAISVKSDNNSEAVVWRCSVKKALKNFAKCKGKHRGQNLFFVKVAGLMLGILLKKRLWHRCFPVNFAKFLRTLLMEHLRATAPVNFASIIL